MSDSSDGERKVGGNEAAHSTDPLGAVLLANYPLLKEEPDFKRLTRLQKMFVYLLGKNVKESTHVDYKTTINSSDDWRFRLLKSACAMYNGLDPAMREPSLTDTDSGSTSSYLVYGVKELDRKSCDLKKHLIPLTSWPGEEELQDCFKSNTMPPVGIYFHLVRFEVDRHFELLGLQIPPGVYALLEIPKGQYGPALFKNCSNKEQRGRSANPSGSKSVTPAFLLYTRTDAQNVPEEEWEVRGLSQKVHEQFGRRYDFHGLFFVKEDLIQESKSFRVLTLSKLTSLKNPNHKEAMARALGQGKWDIIFDFDKDSREQGGHFTFIDEEMERQGRLRSVKSWKELPKIDAKDLDECQRGLRTIYVQVLGCSSTGVPSPTNSSLLKKNLKSKFLEIIFERNHTPRPVMCVTLCLTYTNQELLNLYLSPDKIAAYVKTSFVAESNNEESYKSVVLCTEEPVKQILVSTREKQDNSKDTPLLVPPAQICCLFQSLYSTSKTNNSYKLPGISGTFLITREEFATYRPYLSLYHINSGQSKYQSKGEDQKKDYCHELRRGFLAGNELTKEMLHINDELEFQGTSIYVQRREMKTFEIKVKKSLAYCNDRSFTTWNSSIRQIIPYCHEPASGATTIARIVLWRLREEYPCVEIKSATRLQEAIKGICTIYDLSELPVLILIDSSNFNLSYVRDFVTELNRSKPVVKSVIIFVKKPDLDTPLASLKVKLSDEETAALDKIYQDSVCDESARLTDKVEKETDKTLFLFGVWHFKNDYKKINDFIAYLLNESSSEQKKLLCFASLTQLLTHSPLPLAIAAQFFDLPTEQKDPGLILSHLGLQRNLLLVKRIELGGWGLAPILVVGERILNVFFKSENKIDEQIHAYVKDLCEMGQTGSKSLLFCLQYLVQQLISCPKRILDPQGKFSDFVFLMDKNLTEEKILLLFETLAQSFAETRPHIFIHCARYFAYQKSDYVKSIEITRKALDLKETDQFFSDTTCTDDVVLSLSSHLINCRLGSGPEMQFSEIQSLANDSIRLSKRAREKQRPSRITGDLVYRAHPFCYEIQAQRLLLNYFFSLVCQKNSARYFCEIENQNYFAVKDAHYSILANIFNLEKMHDDDKLEQDTLTEKELRRLNETKEEFVSRYYPSGEVVSSFKKLSPEVSDVAFVWTIVDYCIIKLNQDSKNDYHSFPNQQSDDFSMNLSFKVPLHHLWDRVWRIQKIGRTQVYEKLLSIILPCQSKLTRNYFEACVLLILSKPKNSLNRAIQLTNEWCQKFGFDYDYHASFMHGAFHLAFSLSLNDMDAKRAESLQSAKKAFDACKSLMVKDSAGGRKRTLPGYNRPRFVISAENGISTLAFLPRMQSYEDQEKYIKGLTCRIFTGYLISKNSLVCDELKWDLHVPSKSMQEEQYKQKKKICFAIALAYSGPTPIMIDKINS